MNHSVKKNKRLAGLTLGAIAEKLNTGSLTAENLVVDAIRKIEAPNGQGAIAFREIRRQSALGAAKEWDSLRSRQIPDSPLAGIPIAVKENISVEGSYRRAGSRVLASSAPVSCNAPFIDTLVSLGLIVVGTTNMTEFAYSGLGNNIRFGTPLSHRDANRVSGGSSSGSAVSVMEGIVPLAIGTDTSGSVRIPAAMCGLAAFRPSQGRYPTAGTIPLAPSFDSVGTIANTVECLALLDQTIRKKDEFVEDETVEDGYKPQLVVPEQLLSEVDSRILKSFENLIKHLQRSGIRVSIESMPSLLSVRQCVESAQIVKYEAYQWHKKHLQTRRHLYDPNVAMRFNDAESLSQRAYENGLAHLNSLRSQIDQDISVIDGLLLPTVPIQAPTIDEIAEPDNYLRLNAASFRHTSFANHLDLPAVCFPTDTIDGVIGSAMLVGLREKDTRTLALARILSYYSGLPK